MTRNKIITGICTHKKLGIYLSIFFIVSVLICPDIYARITGMSRLSSIDGSGYGIKLLEPSSIWYDRSGNVFLVANTDAHRVDIVTVNGEFKREMGNKSDLRFPYAVAVDRKRTLYVSEGSSGVVKVISRYSDNFNEDYSLLDFSQVKASYPIKAGKVFVGANDNLYVVDSNEQKILVFTPDLKFKFMFGEKGAGAGKFFKIDDICVDMKGRIYVADSFGGKVQVFGQNGEYLLSIGKHAEKGFIYHPISIDVDAYNRLWIIDSQKQAILVFDLNGNLLFNSPSNFFIEMSLFSPVDITFDQLNRLYLLDKGTGKINVFQINNGF